MKLSDEDKLGMSPEEIAVLEAEVTETLQHFNRVATDPAFAQLAARPEFQSVYGILKHYQQALNPTASSVQLPPPPSFGVPPIR